MRVRPFFWFLLALSCASVLIFAASLHTQAPAVMRVQLDQQSPATGGITTLKLHLTDSQGIPIEKAQVLPMARMTNMNMATDQIRVEPLGQGNYRAQFHFYMSGPWEISIGARADGFEPLEQTLFVQVT
jgi:nitrogen fixation protein FixH